MKKILALLLMLAMSVALFTGCGSDPVYDDLENFLNVEMTEVNANYTKIKEEVSKWTTYEDDAAILNSLNEVLLPLVDGSIAALEGINPATEEVKTVKDKYVKVMDAYKEGFGNLAKGAESQVEETINAGYEKISEAVELLEEYNKALEELAAEHGSEIEY